MTPLRAKMIRELELHRKAPKTIEAYVTAVAPLAQHDGRSPEAIAIEEVRGFLDYLITQRRVAFSPKAPGVRPLRVGRQARLHAGAAHLGPAVAAPLPRARSDGLRPTSSPIRPPAGCGFYW
jgi:hypothetical protein